MSMRLPSDRMLRVMLQNASARSVYRNLRDRGFDVKREQLETLRTVLVALGQARELKPRQFNALPTTAGVAELDGSRGLLHRQLITGQHSIRDPQRVAELLQDLAA